MRGNIYKEQKKIKPTTMSCAHALGEAMTFMCHKAIAITNQCVGKKTH